MPLREIGRTGTWDVSATAVSSTSIMINHRSWVEIYNEHLQKTMRLRGVILQIIRRGDRYFVSRPMIDALHLKLAESNAAYWPSAPASIDEYDLRMRRIRSIKTTQRFQAMALNQSGDLYVLTGGCESGTSEIKGYSRKGAAFSTVRTDAGTGSMFASRQGYIVTTSGGCLSRSGIALRIFSERLTAQGMISGISANSVLDFGGHPAMALRI